MTFEEILDQAIAMLQRRGRVTYRTLKLQFELDDERLDALKEELIDAEELVVDKDGKMLVWTGDGAPPATPSNRQAQIDTETQGFLDTLSQSVASAHVLLLVNYRPEYRHEWGQKTYYTQLRLAPLGKAEADELLTFLLGSEASLTALKSLILEKTEGTLFFMKEVVQTLVEEGALTGERGKHHLERTPTELHVSPTVQGVLAARIDRLNAAEKALLQQLAVIGRQFPVSLVKQVVSQPETELHRVLSSLQAKEFLYEQPAFPRGRISLQACADPGRGLWHGAPGHAESLA